MKLQGDIIIQTTGTNSKSEHEAVYFNTEQGNYILRCKTENPFENTKLKNYNGKRVECEGVIDQYVFMIDTTDNINSVSK